MRDLYLIEKSYMYDVKIVIKRIARGFQFVKPSNFKFALRLLTSMLSVLNEYTIIYISFCSVIVEIVTVVTTQYAKHKLYKSLCNMYVKVGG